tara:strand:- start:6947 stop:7696 length:750 start_codon:yes stop_codon:yes gene_type:complete
MNIDWTPLRAELSQWRNQDLPLAIWWRDDDAVAPTPALDRLTALAEDLTLPVHIAVIPKAADPSLPLFTRNNDMIVPLVHGWQHVSHAPQGAKNAEFGHPREGAGLELAEALQRMHDLFGKGLLPIFVPPWNRLDPALLPRLAQTGYVGVSTYLPRDRRQAAPGLVQINTHIDPIFWRGDRGLVPPEDQIAHIVRLLQDRRSGKSDATEPLGFLTHHLVHNEDIWNFTRACLKTFLDAGALPAHLHDLP